MKDKLFFDVIIVGGSYSGLAAAMALGRALRNVLVIDSGEPCNRKTPYSHNFITQDGEPPAVITKLAKQQVEKYNTVIFLNAVAIKGTRRENVFEIETASGELLKAKKIVFATGIKDILPEIPGLVECWGITILHCPFCHGYEVRQQKTGILGNGDYGFEFSTLISNWTNELTLYTNGKSTLTAEQIRRLQQHNIAIIESEIVQLQHHNGYIQYINFKGGKLAPVKAIYTRTPFVQHCTIPETMGCQLNEEGFIKVDATQKTSVPGIFASGDSTTRLRTVANAVAMGTTAGMMVNRELIEESF